MSAKSVPVQTEAFPKDTQALALKDEADMRSTAVSIAEQARALAGQMEEIGIEVGDLEIPKLMLMQGTSGYVGEGTAKLGDIINTMDMEVLGTFEKHLEIIPLKLYKTLRIYNAAEKPPKFIRAEALNEVNSLLPWEGVETTEEGKEIPVKRVVNMNFFVLVLSQVQEGLSHIDYEKMDPNQVIAGFPAVVSFKSLGMRAGKALGTQMFKMMSLGRLPYSQSASLGCRKEKKDTNTFAVFEIGKGKELTKWEKIVAKNWLARLASMNYKVAEKAEDEDFVHAESSPAATVIPSVQGKASGPNDIF